MKDDTFKDAVDNMGKNFGLRGQLLQDKYEILWQEFKNVPDDIFVKACKMIIENDERFPNIRRIRECLMGFRLNSIITQTECKLCSNNGIFSTLKKMRQGGKEVWLAYSFRCTCPNGERLARGIPVWHPMWLKKGHVPFAEWEVIYEIEQDEEKKNPTPEVVTRKRVIDEGFKAFLRSLDADAEKLLGKKIAPKLEEDE